MFLHLSNTTSPSFPQFLAICRSGASQAFAIIAAPSFSSSSSKES